MEEKFCAKIAKKTVPIGQKRGCAEGGKQRRLHEKNEKVTLAGNLVTVTMVTVPKNVHTKKNDPV